MELRFLRERNRQERLTFVRGYALRVRRVPNEVWNRKQADLIDVFLEKARRYALFRARYLEMQQDITRRWRHGPVDESGCV